MKNSFRENRVVWDGADGPEQVAGGGVAGEAVSEAPKVVPEKTPEQLKLEETAKQNRDTLMTEIKLRQTVLYKNLVDYFQGTEVTVTDGDFRSSFKQKVWEIALSKDAQLWDDIEIGFDEKIDIWQPDAEGNPLKYFVEHGKKNEVLAELFVSDVFSKIENGKKIEDYASFTLKYGPDGIGVDWVKKEVKSKGPDAGKDSSVEEDSRNYDAMADRFLKIGGFGRFIVMGLVAFNIIPSKSNPGETLEQTQRKAVVAALQGKDPTLGWFCDAFGVDGKCKGLVKDTDEAMASAGETANGLYDKMKGFIVAYVPKAAKEVQAINEAGKLPKAPESSKPVLARVEVPGKYYPLKDSSATFLNDETVPHGYNLEVLIPKNLNVGIQFGDVTAAAIKGAAPEQYTAGQTINADSSKNKTVVFAEDSVIRKDTVFSQGVVLSYVKKEAPKEAA